MRSTDRMVLFESSPIYYIHFYQIFWHCASALIIMTTTKLSWNDRKFCYLHSELIWEDTRDIRLLLILKITHQCNAAINTGVSSWLTAYGLPQWPGKYATKFNPVSSDHFTVPQVLSEDRLQYYSPITLGFPKWSLPNQIVIYFLFSSCVLHASPFWTQLVKSSFVSTVRSTNYKGARYVIVSILLFFIFKYFPQPEQKSCGFHTETDRSHMAFNAEVKNIKNWLSKLNCKLYLCNS